MANSITKIYKNGVEYDIYASGGASVNTASATTAGVVKLGSDTVQTQAANSPSSTSGKTYPIQVNNGGQEVVNVPWTDHTYTSSSFDIKDLTDSTELRTTWSGKQDALVSGTNIKTVNNESILGSGNIAISGGHDYSWNTLTGTSFTLSGTNYRNLISTSSDTTVSVGTGLTPGMEYIIRITNSDSDNDHTMTFNSVAYIIPKSGTVTYKWLALTATTVEFEGPRYVYSMPATPEEGFIYYVLPESGGGGWQPGANTLVYYKFDNNLNDSSGNSHTASMAQGSATYYTVSGDNKAITASGNVVQSGIGQANILAASHTLSFWVDFTTIHTSSTMPDNRIMGCLGASGSIAHLGILQNASSGYCFYIWQPTGSHRKYSYTFTANSRYNIVLSIDNSLNCSCYINGVLVDTKTINSPGTADFYFGNCYQLTGSDRLDGYLDDIIVESKAWTATEVSDYYNATKSDYGL